MCEPITMTSMAMAGLQGIQSISAINDQNAAAAENSIAARVAANDEFEGTTSQYIEEQRSLVQGGFDAILEGRAAEAESYTSAIQNGVRGASVKAVLRDVRQKTERGASRTKQEMESLARGTTQQFRNITSRTKARIASVPTTKFGLGDVAQIVTPIIRGQMD